MGLAGKSAPPTARVAAASYQDGGQNPSRYLQHSMPARSWGAATSVSTTSGSAGSPSAGRSDQAGSVAGAATPASDSTALRLNHLDIHGDEAASPGGGRKKKRAARAVGPDNGGRGLRQFSLKVCEKVESKGRTSYNEVADELVTEFADSTNQLASVDQQYDEKNIRRRVYDAINVLRAMDIISKDKKEIQWKGLPRTSPSDVEELKSERTCLQNRIDKKAAYLRELEEQFVGLQKLIQRNEHLYESGHAPAGGVALPFILVQTRPHATVEVEISEDMQLVHFDFNSTPFELHDDAYVLKAMNLSSVETRQDSGANEGDSSSKQIVHQNRLSDPSPGLVGKPTAPHPVPGILKGRLKYEP